MADVTVTEFLLFHQKKSPHATGKFTGLIYDLILSCKTISRRINKSCLLDILGGTGVINVQGEAVQKIDDLANSIMIYRMERSGAMCAMSSEENPDLIRIGPEFPRGDYIMIFDPLDGSSNMDVNINLGTIFSIYRRPEGSSGEVRRFNCQLLLKHNQLFLDAFINLVLNHLIMPLLDVVLIIIG